MKNKEDDGWKSVNHKNGKSASIEEVLKEAQFEDYDEVDLEELDEEIILEGAKKTGFKRTDPTAPSECISDMKELFKCK